MVENQTRKVKGIVVIILLIITGAVSTSLLLPNVESTYTYDVKMFQSYDELYQFYQEISSNEDSSPYGVFGGWGAQRNMLSMPEAAMMDDSIGGTKSEVTSSDVGSDYSSTNVQVEGVDEPDIVKTDGTYIYVVSGQEIFMVKAYPPADSRVVSSISFDNYSVSNIFINDEYLIIFGASYNLPVYSYGAEKKMMEPALSYCYHYEPSTTIYVFDLSDIEDPKKVKTIDIDGSFFDARMIGNYVYVISIQYNHEIFPLMEENETYAIPTITIDDEVYTVKPQDIYYMESPEPIETTTHIACIDLNDRSVTQKSFLLGSSQSLYASENTIYLTSHHYSFPSRFFSSQYNGEYKELVIIHKISLEGTTITYEGKGEVPGRVLNQFSMDEYDGFFRIATTIGNNWDEKNQLQNNVYVLDSNLKQVGAIENIAPGEEIYSARFMGEKAYLVTFKKIDPFFTIDISDPYNPKILGKLKIPGYSDYLHPFDENHIIGIGKDTVEALEDEESWRSIDFSWHQGIKIALFDVSDFENPVELSKVVIGDRGTGSPVLYDHKAFLFDREKNLLVIPVDLYEIDEEIKQQQGNYTGSIYGEFTFQGAYIYDLSIEEGFELKGTITHLSDDEMLKSGFYPLRDKSISRSLYIEDYLYTISQSMVKVNSLDSLTEKQSIELC